MRRVGRFFIALLVLSLLLSAPFRPDGIAFGASNVSYLDAGGTQQTAASATDMTSGSASLSTGWYVVSSSVSVSGRIVVSGNVNLILANGYTLTASTGITVGAGNSLTIYAQSTGSSMGALTATGGANQAGIGGDNAAAGTITINGGKINATGGDLGAGIGGGSGGSGGTITINGGNVTASGANQTILLGGNFHGSGIGGGDSGSGGSITITGGTVNASGGGYGGAAIGSGSSYNISGTNTLTGGTILISGGTVTATGNTSRLGGGAGIGGGSGYNGSVGSAASGTITITGNANVIATGGSGASSAGGGGAAIGSGGAANTNIGAASNIFINTTGTLSLTGGTGQGGAASGAQAGMGGGTSNYGGTPTEPTAPQNLAASPGNGQVALSWATPQYTGMPITSYQVSSGDGGTWTSVGNVLATTVTGLTNGTAYDFQVRAINSTGNGVPCAVVSASPAPVVPGAPQTVTASGGNATATVNWTAPSDNGGSAVTNYTVTASPGGMTANAASSPATVSGLTNGTAYTFTVTATNVAGTGPASASASATPITTPGAPQNLTATPGNTQVVLTWAEPASDGGSVITEYEVSSDGGSTWTSVGTNTSYMATSLSNGTPYSFQVRAINAAGSGSAASASGTPMTNPNPPQNLTATPGDTQVILSWDPPSNTGGGSITYQVSLDNGTTWISVATDTSYTATGLTNGTTYSFQVRADNTAGPSTTLSVSATPLTVPGAPQNLVATAGNAQVSLTWNAPSGNGGSAITGYEVSSDNGSNWTSVGTGTSYTVTKLSDDSPLSNGTAYNFQVRAVNAAGEGAATSVSSTPVKIPGAPTITGVAPGNGQAIVAFTAPTDTGGSDITGYTVTSSPGGITATGTDSPIIVTSLTNGTAYTFTVTATNSVGVGTPSAASSTATPSTVPDAPAGVSAASADGQATVTFTPPADGGSAITSYTVTSSPDGITASGAGSPIDVTGLANGTAYIFTVVATNANGASSPSSASSPVTPCTVPGAPQDFGAAPSNDTATLTWTAPASDGGSVITDYEFSIDNGNTWTPTGVTSSPYIVQGLTDGATYEFLLRAVNAVGPGATATTSTTLPTVPDPPQSLVATAGNAQVTLSWSAPTDDGGSIITGYEVSSNGTNWTPVGNVTSYTFTGLTNGTAYTLSVHAVNVVGSSTDVSAGATPISVPTAPLTLSASASDKQIVLTWAAPADNGGSAVTGYEVSSNGGSSWVNADLADLAVSSFSYTFTGLIDGTQYTLAVRAVNAAGEGAPATISAIPVTTPSAPQNFKIASGNKQLTLTWNAPSDDGGSAVTAYEISSDGTTWTSIGSVMSYTVSGLTNGTSYSYRIRAVNAVGNGTSTSVVSATPMAIPGVPLNLSANAGNATVALSWASPTDNGGSAITGYEVSSDGGSDWTSAGTNTSYTVTSLSNGDALSNGTAYTFQVRAVNAVGAGSAASITAIPQTNASAPLNLSVTAVGNGTVSLSWVVPVNLGGGTLQGYEVSSTNGSTWTSDGISGTTYTATGLTNGTTYNFQVRAVTEVSGANEPGAAASISATPMTTPSAPQSVTATAGDKQITLNWHRPADNGGSAITGYEVSSDGGSTWVDAGNGTSYTVTSLSGGSALVNGTSYSLELRAVNAAGNGTASSPVSATPFTTPGTPTGVTATAGNGTASVSFTAPSDGGSTITGYTVVSNPAGIAVSGTSSPITVTGLTNGVDYTFTVTAKNAAGSGTASAPSASVTPSTVPGAPTGVNAVAGNGTVALSWSSPADNGGSAITEYEVSTDGGGSWTSVGTAASYAATGLTNGNSYQFKVRAKNANGESEAVASAAVTPYTVPGKPQNLTAAPGVNQVTLSWSAPANNGGSPVTGYEISYDSGVTWTQAGNTTSYTVKGLTAGTNYTFMVAAVNAAVDADTAPASISAAVNGVPLYEVIRNFGTWRGSGTASSYISADYNKFVRLLHSDGTPVDPGYYTAASGSTIITFTTAYLDTLANGEYYYIAEYTDGETPNIQLIIDREAGTDPDSPNTPGASDATGTSGVSRTPDTGDETAASLLFVLMLLSIAGIITLVLRRRRLQE
ncbi:hypothetical protein AGMMS49983_11510 [Clostridia bacterium]|nr:hypothetical protein AGMMS49983_11510 [Clostridia bacterium]